MKYSYFPGCAAHGTASDQHLSVSAVFRALDIELVEVPDWNCCGASAGHTVGGALSIALSSRNIEAVKGVGLPVMVPCAACFSNLRKAALQETSRRTPGAADAEPNAEVLSIATVLAEAPVLRRIRERRVRTGRAFKIVPYYGCLLTRPAETTGSQSPENPTSIEAVAEACGLEYADWSHKTDCCGGPHTLAHPELVEKMSTALLERARRWGAEAIVTACPMCHASLDTTQWKAARRGNDKRPIPIFYLSEIVALSMGLSRQRRWLKRHLIDPTPLLREKGVLS